MCVWVWIFIFFFWLFSHYSHCTHTECRPDEFQCYDGLCLSQRQRCDDHPDCHDGSDERDCHCQANQFRCHSIFQCIDSRLRCDYKYDCFDHTDELHCGMLCYFIQFFFSFTFFSKKKIN